MPVHKKTIFSIFLLSLGMLFFKAEAQEPAMFSVAGFATVDGTTNGGEGGDTIVVSTGNQLQDAINDLQDNPASRVIIVNGVITPENSAGLSKIDIKDVDNLTILGAGGGAEFNGIGLKIRRASNIILRNLKVHHVLTGEKDCIGIEGPADHIWIDHCELYNEFEGVEKDYYDGLLDAKSDCEYLTYSWNYLHDSWKTALVGSSEGDTHDRKLTMHHNWFSNCNSRIPLFRASTGHFFNNYYEQIASTAINSRINSCARIENNYFLDTRNPWVSAYSDILGGGEVSGNILENSWFEYADDTHELPACTADIPYSYEDLLHEASEVPDLVREYAGVGKLGSQVGIKQISNSREPGQDLIIKPNPLESRGYIEFFSDGKRDIRLCLISLHGKREVLFIGHLPEGLQRIEIDVKRFSPGLYLVQLIQSNRSVVSRIVINSQL